MSAPCGTWSTPITPALVVEGARSISELQIDGDALVWLELRPDEGGRTVIVRRGADGTQADVTGPQTNVRTRVHEYGGGSYLADGGTVWYVEFADQAVYRLEAGGSPQRITPDPPAPGAVRYADFALAPQGTHLLCVRETHHGEAATDVVNELVALPVDGSGDPVVIASGHDFYAAPRPAPDGRSLAYTRWDHPNMPWDETSLVVADLDGLDVSGERVIAGGPGTQESAILPAWSPDGALHVVTDRSGWWNLYRLEGEALRNLAPAEVDLGQPPWQLGQSLYGFLADGTIAVVATQEAVERPSVLDPSRGTVEALPVPHTTCRSLVAGGDTVWFVGASPTAFPQVVRVAMPERDPTVAYETRALPVDAAWLPLPEPISFPTGDDETAHAHFYPPTNPGAAPAAGERPPLIVTSHGGPTGHNAPQASLAVAFWTSRGFAVVDVNYRGSTGFGRAYRDALRGRWGVADVEDCIAAARFLADHGAVDGDRLVIRGGSASGYTTLCALAFHDVFAAGASYYGVADVGLLVAETHKFESRYIDRLIGPLPAAEGVYRERSPLHHPEGLTSPVILFQGLEDRIVPPSQAEAMVAALAANGVPHAYVAFGDEQHGFRHAGNLVACLEAELSFYAQVLGFPHPEGVEPVPLRS